MAIGIAVGKVIDRYKMAKHFDIIITDNDLIIERRSQPIDDEGLARWFLRGAHQRQGRTAR